VILVGDEPTAPYERPALSKEYLAGKRSEQQLLLRPPGFWSGLGVDLRLGRHVTHIDPARRTATLASGEALAWDALVLATGARPRRLPFAAPRGVHTLRTLADARALRASLVPGARLVVVGGGFIGAEVASTALGLGVEVTMVEALRMPFERTLGAQVGTLLAERYRSHGVDLRVATGVVGFRADADARVRAVRLDDGGEIACHVAVVGIGVEPADDLAPHPHEGVPVYACGDVTGGTGHWTSAATEAAAVARRIMGQPTEPRPPAFFWSDQFGLRLQLIGDSTAACTVAFDGDRDSFMIRYRDHDGRLIGALAANRPDRVAALRTEIVADGAFQPAKAA
jgi:NADPH-dependent 2,4-dienoyl-CoA reductase/sulfur reductase-like enzyme